MGEGGGSVLTRESDETILLLNVFAVMLIRMAESMRLSTDFFGEGRNIAQSYVRVDACCAVAQGERDPCDIGTCVCVCVCVCVCACCVCVRLFVCVCVYTRMCMHVIF